MMSKKTKTGSKKKVAKPVKAATTKHAAVKKQKIAKIAKKLHTMARLVTPKAARQKLVKEKKATEQPEEFIIKKVFKAAQLKVYKQLLDNLRERVVGEISFLAGDNLNRSQRESSGDLSSYSFHMADQGTDNFDREFALNLVSSEQDVLYEIDDALGRIKLGTYGVCEGCAKAIEKPRLAALPFAKLCIRCKSEAEKGKTRFRPFGPSLSQGDTGETSS
ncbi:MAG TPA: TraR/DksA C4-type zinc finger protein [Kiritimatiellia bacterium]|nr:TraR/DksA C4-type zinc finger protein [Kiritimatiellia bacterium]